MAQSARTWLLLAALMACTPHTSRDGEIREVVEPQPVASVHTPAPTRLKRWMEAELLYRIRTKDFRGLVRSLDALASVAPPEYPHWASVAAEASRAARARDGEAVRRGCAECHQQYRARYRSTPIDYDIDRLIERSRP
jgi:hypothetical protein